MQYDNILVPVDFSEASINAVSTAIDMAGDPRSGSSAACFAAIGECVTRHRLGRSD